MANRINFQIGYTVDKAGLTEMQSLFQRIANMAKEPGNQLKTGLQQAAATANTLDQILEKTFNTNLGTLNVTKFNQELNKSGLTLKQVQTDLSKVGNQGATAYNRLAQAVLGTNLQLKQSSKLLDDMADTLTKTVKWGLASSLFNNVTNSIQRAYSYSKQLDTSLNDIRIVTDKSAENMDRFAESANEAAKQMGASTLDYTNAALIYYQQGLSDEETAARAETTIKAANVTGQTGEEVSQQLTAVWNGYKATAEETELYVDKLAAVAATTAADLEELSLGMSKVASAANAMGVDFDDLNAQIATIVSVTRQAPESVGTALKTIYARLGDLKVDGVDEFGVSLGEVSSQLEVMGIQILDQNGNMRDMTSVMTEVAEKWNTWTRAQQQAAAVAMAGKRQYNNLVALFENWDMYSDALETSANAMGTLQHQQDIYMESTEAKLKTLKATWQDLYKGIIDEDELNTGIEALTNLVQVFDNFFDSFGGGIKSIAAFGTIIANIFNKQIINGINDAIQRQEVFKQNLELMKTSAETRALGVANLEGAATPQEYAQQENAKVQFEYAQKIYDARVGLNQEQANTLINYQKELGELQGQLTYIEKISEQNAKKYLTEEQYNQILKEGEDAVYKIQEDYDNSIQKLISIKKIIKEIIDEGVNYSGYRGQINKAVSELNDKEKQELEILLDQVHSVKDFVNEEDKINNLLDKQIQKQKISQKVAEKINEDRIKSIDIQASFTNTKQEADAMLDLAKNSKDVAQNVTLATSALSSMAMAWSSVNSLFQTWNDNTASFGDKITQSFMTLGFTLPMIISSFNKLKDVFGINILLTEAETAAIDANSARKEFNTVMTQLREDAMLSEEAVIELSTKADLLQEAAIEAETIARVKNKGVVIADTEAEALNTIASKGNLLSKIKLAFGVKTHTIAVENENIALWANKMALMGVVAAAALAVAAIAGIIKAIDAWHKKEIEKAKTTLEEVDALEKQAQANGELVSSFNKLYNEYNKLKQNQEDVSSVSKDLYENTLKLAEAYDIQGASLLALGDHYDIIRDKIKEKRDTELKNIIEESDRGAQAASNEIGHSMTKGTGYISNNTYSSSIGTGNVMGSVYGPNLQEAATALGLSDKVKKTQGAGQMAAAPAYTYEIKFNISDPEETAKELENINNLIKYYKSRYDDEILNSDPVYQGLLKEQEQFMQDSQFDELMNQMTTKYNAEIERAVNKIDFAKLSTKEIYDNIEKIKSSLEGLPEDKIDGMIHDSLEGISDIENELTKIDLAEQINKKTGEKVEDIIDIIDNYDESQLSLLQISLDTALLDGNLQKWVDDHTPLILQTELITSQNLIENALNNYSDKKGFQDTDISNIFANENAMNQIGMTEDQFKSLDYGDQLQLLTEAWMKDTKAIVENKEATIDSLTKEKREVQQEIYQFEKVAETGEETFNKLIDGHKKLEKKQEDLKEVLIKVAEDGINNLDVESRALLDDFMDLTGANETQVKGLGEIFKETRSYENAIKSLEAEIKKITNIEEDHAKAVELIETTQSAHSAVLDNIQSAYKSLNSIIEDYNKTGEWTIDNVQQLISMDNEYVATLSMENGQLVINDQAFQAMTLAKINDLEQTILLKMQEELLALAERQSADAASANAEQQIYQAAMVRDGIEAAEAGAAAWRDFAAAQREAAGVAGAEYDKEAQKIIDAAYNRLKAAESAKESVKKGGTSFKNAMGAGSKSKSGGKDKKEKEGKEYKDEFDRYWDIKKAIDAVERALSKLDKKQEKLFGYELIKSLKLENQLLDQQTASYQALAEAQKAEAAELQGVLAGYGVAFDASGAITNYAAATAAALQQYNQAIQQYNAGLLDESALGVYEKNYEAFKKALERYDTLYYTEMKETQEKLEEIRRKELENNLKAWETEIKIKLDMKELERQWNDFIKEVTKDFQKVYEDLRVNLKTMLKDAQTYIGTEGTLGTIINAVHDVTKEIDKMRSGGSSDMFESISQAQEKLKELNDQLLDNAKALHDLWEEAWDNYIDGIDQVADKFDDLIDRFDKINDELEFQKQLVELLYGEEAFGLMSKVYAGQQHNMEEQLKSLKQQKDMWESLFYASGATLENQTEWTEDQQKYYEQWMEAQGDLNDLVINYIKLLKDDYLNTVKDVLKQFENMVTSGKGLGFLGDQWDRISDRADKYFDSVEGAYEIQKLANKIDEGIASTTNLKNQQKLQEFRDKEIKYLREKENLTQYDLDAAEARYEIMLKEAALEDARNNKTSMKLTRNEQGNWSYQYIADEDDVMSKEQDLLDAYSRLYQLASDAYEANLEALLNLQETYLEKAQEIYESEVLSEEQKQEQLYALREWYLEEYRLLAEENTLSRNDLELGASALLLEIYRQDQEAYTTMTETERELLDNLINAHTTGFMDLENKMINNYHNIGEKAREVMEFTRADWTSGAQAIADLWNGDNGFSVRVQVLQAYDAIENATKRYQNLVDICAQIVERDFSEQGIAGAIIRAEQETDNLSNKTVDLVNTCVPYLEELRKFVDMIGAAWQSVQAEIMNAIDLIQEYLKYIGDVSAAIDQLNSGGGATPGGVSPDGGDSGPGKGGSGNDKLHYDIIDDPNGVPGTKAIVKMDENRNIRQYIIIDSDANINKIKGKYGLATGGYTGSWNGSDGKFAMLHQKELVLNADDTKNFLSGINMIRDMSNVNGSIEKSILRSVANMVTSLRSPKAGSINTSSSVTNENGNTFNITAEFPNANDVNEIREAILTLPNIASQYINRSVI